MKKVRRFWPGDIPPPSKPLSPFLLVHEYRKTIGFHRSWLDDHLRAGDEGGAKLERYHIRETERELNKVLASLGQHVIAQPH